MSDTTSRPPLADDVLVRYLDGACAPHEAAAVEAEAPQGPTAERLWELEESGRLFARVVDEVTVPPVPTLPSARPRPRWRAAAAVAALLACAGVAAALPTSRGWIVTSFERALGRPPTGSEAPSAAPVRGSATIGVPFVGAELLLQVDGEPRGSLRVEHAAGDVAAGTAAGAAASDVVVSAPGWDLWVLPDGLRLRAADDAPETVVLSLPAGVRRLRIRTAADERVVDLGRTGVPTTLALSPPSR